MTHQEYIHTKYLSQGDYETKEKKRKIKKLAKIKNSTVKIVDDDVDFRTLGKVDSDEEELYFGTKEEKPIIAGVIDERPLADKDRSKWKRLGDDNEVKIKSEDEDDTTTSVANTSSKSKAKTLSGKRAGLSNAKEIRKELDELKRKNEKFMKGLSDEQSGKNAQTVFRDRKTGKIRDMEKELAEKEKEDREKELKEAAKKATYDKWSKGLVQREAHLERLESDLHEMSKPLARYGDDSDLDKLLRDKERLDDPMLQEIRKKREEEEKARNPNLKVFPKYKGPPPPPNRFNIQPGYRWDGVDRSTGYEAKIFLRQSNAEANQEEAYRWSTQDM